MSCTFGFADDIMFAHNRPSIGNESLPKTVINNTINLFFKLQSTLR